MGKVNTGIWEAMLQSGGIELLEMEMILEIQSFFKKLQDVLDLYRAPDGSESAFVPEAIVQSAVPADDDTGKNRQCGPADAVVDSDDEVSSDSDSDLDLEAAVVEPPANQESAAALWSNALTNGQSFLGGITAKDLEKGAAGFPSVPPPASEGNPDAQQWEQDQQLPLHQEQNTLIIQAVQPVQLNAFPLKLCSN